MAEFQTEETRSAPDAESLGIARVTRDELGRIYLSTSEGFRKKLFAFLRAQKPEVAEKLYRRVANKIGGARFERVMSRATDAYGRQLDRALLKDFDDNFETALVEYFVDTGLEANRAFVGEMRSLAPAPSVEQVCVSYSRLSATYRDEESKLFWAALRCFFWGWFTDPAAQWKTFERDDAAQAAAGSAGGNALGGAKQEQAKADAQTIVQPGVRPGLEPATISRLVALSRRTSSLVRTALKLPSFEVEPAAAELRSTAAAIAELYSAVTGCGVEPCESKACVRDGKSAPLCAAVVSHRPRTVGELLDLDVHLSALADGIRNAAAEAEAEEALASRFARDLGEPELVPVAPEAQSCEAAFARWSKAALLRSERESRLRTEIERKRTSLTGRLAAIAGRYRLNAAQASRYAELGRLATQITSLSEHEAAVVATAEFEAKVEEEAVSLAPERLVREVIDGTSPRALVSLFRWLESNGESDVAVLVAWLAQFSGLEDLQGGDCRGLAAVLCGPLSGKACLSPEMGAGLFAAQPWLSQLDGADTDLDEAKLVLSVASVCAARWSRESVHVCFSLDAENVFGPGRPALRHIAELVREGRPFRVSPDDPLAPLKIARQSVESGLVDPFSHLRDKGHHVGKALTERLLPRLRSLWATIQQQPTPFGNDAERLVAQTRDRLTADVDQVVERHAFFSKEARELVCDVVGRMIHYMRTSNETSSKEFVIVQEATLAQEFSCLERDYPFAAEFWRRASVLMREPAVERPSDPAAALEHMCLRSRTIAQRLPGLVIKVCHDPTLVPERSDLLELAAAFESRVDTDEIARRLEKAECFDQAESVLRGASREQAADALVERARGVRDGLILRCKSDAVGDVEREGLVEQLRAGRYAWVRAQLEEAEKRLTTRLNSRADAANEALRRIRTTLRALHDPLDACDETAAWKQDSRNLLYRADNAIARFLDSGTSAAEKEAGLKRAEEVEHALAFHVRHASTDFAALERLISPAREQPAEATQSGPSFREVLEDSDHSPEEEVEDRQRLWQVFQSLGSERKEDAKGGGSEVRELLRAIARKAMMYSNEGDAEERFAYYFVPGLPAPSAKSAFWKSGSNHFEARLLLHVLPGKKPSMEWLRIMQRHLEASEGIHLVFVPGEPGGVRRFLEQELHDGRAAVIDSDAFRRMLESPSFASPLRHALCQAIGLEETSPFTSEGHVTETRNIFVGRETLVKKLVNGESYVLWGGRRSGKTSLLHGVRRKFEGMRAKPYRVCYETMEGMPESQGDAADLWVARRLAVLLDWGVEPASVDEFSARLRAQCERPDAPRVCLLLDEMDKYLRLSQTHEIIRVLRGVRNALGEKDRLVCIFAGFKALFRAVTMSPSPNDASYPWKNFVEQMPPVAKLDLRATTQLVREGFVSLLGMRLEPLVAQKVFEMTGGHPAFVQSLCHCVVKRVARQGRREEVTIGPSHFDEAFRDDAPRSFIHFVDDTLRMNLGPLEHIIILVMAAEVLDPKAPDAFHGRRAITERVNYWYGSMRKDPPDERSYEESFRFLSMTGMLEESTEVRGSPGTHYKFAFASYVTILSRLERANTDRIFNLIAGGS